MKELIHLYPKQWRRRYEEEFIALLDECPTTLSTIFDIIVGALDAHFREHVANGRAFLMANVTRTSILTVFCAFVAFCFAGLWFYGMVDDSPFVPMMSMNPSLNISWLMVEAGSVIAALAVLVGGLPIVLEIWGRPQTKRRLFVLSLTAIAVIGLLGITIIAISVWLSVTREVFAKLFLPYSVVAHVGVLAGAAGVAVAVARSEISRQTFRFAFVPAVVATLAMGLMLAGTILWGFFAHAGNPQAFGSDMDYLGISISYATLLLLIVAGMAGMTGIAAISVIYGIFTGRENENGNGLQNRLAGS